MAKGKGPNDGAPGGGGMLDGGTETPDINPGNDGTAAEPVAFKVVSAAKRDALDAQADKDFPGWRTGNAQDLPLESIPADKLIATQKYVHRPKVEKEKAKFRKRGGFKKEPLVMKLGGKFYIRDGHHRATAAVEDGAPNLPVRIMDMDGGHAAIDKAEERPRKAHKIADNDAYANTNNVKVKFKKPNDVSEYAGKTKTPSGKYHGTGKIGGEGKIKVKKDLTLGDVHAQTALGNGKKKKLKKGDWSVMVPIMKMDNELHVVYGWSTVTHENGQIVTDHQNDQIETAELTKAMHDFMMSSRQGGIMHFAENGKALKGGEIVECIVFSPEVQKALGIDLKKVGAFIGYKVHDKAIWKMVKDGTLKAFSIGGSGTRVPL